MKLKLFEAINKEVKVKILFASIMIIISALFIYSLKDDYYQNQNEFFAASFFLVGSTVLLALSIGKNLELIGLVFFTIASFQIASIYYIVNESSIRHSFQVLGEVIEVREYKNRKDLVIQFNSVNGMIKYILNSWDHENIEILSKGNFIHIRYRIKEISNGRVYFSEFEVIDYEPNERNWRDMNQIRYGKRFHGLTPSQIRSYHEKN